MEAPPPLKEEDLDRPEPLMLDPTLEHQVQWADVVAKFCKELRPVHPEGSIFDINQMEFIPSEEKDKLAHLAMAPPSCANEWKKSCSCRIDSSREVL